MNKITQQVAQRIIEEYIAGASSYELADEYEIWQTSICNLISGRTWKTCIRPNNIEEIIQCRRDRGLNVGRACKDLLPLSILQTDILIGSLLGDGTLTKGKNSRFAKKQHLERKNYLEWHFERLAKYSATLNSIYTDNRLIEGPDGRIKRINTKKYLSGYGYQTFAHPNLTALRDQWYKNNQKIVPTDLSLNPQRIAIWYFDDGSNNYKNRVAVLCTQSFTLEEADFLRERLRDFDLQPIVTKVKSKYTGRLMPILKFSRGSYDNLIALVKPFMLWDCFAHKVEWHHAQKQWETSGAFDEKEATQVLALRKTKTAKEIAEIYGVHVNTIYAMVSGRSWKHLQR